MTLAFDLALIKRLTLNTAATAADITDPDTILLYDTTSASVLKVSFAVLVEAIATAMAATPRAGAFTTLSATGNVNFNGANAAISYAPTGSGTVTINPATLGNIDNVRIGNTTKQFGGFTNITYTGQLTSSIATGTPPLVVISTTNVPNLNASLLGGATFAAPGPIGSTTANTGKFTTIQATNESGSANTTAMMLHDSTGNYGFGMGPTSSEAFVNYYSGTANNANHGHRFLVNGVEKLKIDGTGLVTVSDKLKVVGNIGFYNTTPIAKPTASGSRAGNAALASLLTALSNLGLITDSSTA